MSHGSRECFRCRSDTRSAARCSASPAVRNRFRSCSSPFMNRPPGCSAAGIRASSPDVTFFSVHRVEAGTQHAPPRQRTLTRAVEPAASGRHVAHESTNVDGPDALPPLAHRVERQGGVHEQAVPQARRGHTGRPALVAQRWLADGPRMPARGTLPAPAATRQRLLTGRRTCTREPVSADSQAKAYRPSGRYAARMPVNTGRSKFP